MSAEEFDAGACVDRLAAALPAPATAQEPYLREYREQHCADRVPPACLQ